MAGSGRPGVAPLTAQREEYARLIAQGVSNSEACRRVGVNRKTGNRWRYGRVVPARAGGVVEYAPVKIEPVRVLSRRYLSEDERGVIADERDRGATIREIAAQLDRSPSTVSRELRRNRDDTGRYRPAIAHRLARDRLARPRARRIAGDPALQALVQKRLDERWSPEQIAATLRLEHPDRADWHLATESIYQAMYCRDSVLTRRLRTGRARRRPHRRGDARRPRGLPAPMLMVDERPAHVQERVEPGHWEGDLIMGAGNRSAIGTLVERVSRAVVLVHLGADRTATALRDALVALYRALPAALRRSLTWDQGREMSAHLDVSAALDMPVYFCQPHSPWQRGSNENTNGLLRQYFPKHTDLSVYQPEHLATVTAELNARPRKTLGWQTPAYRLATLLQTAS